MKNIDAPKSMAVLLDEVTVGVAWSLGDRGAAGEGVLERFQAKWNRDGMMGFAALYPSYGNEAHSNW